ncbi:hypothetical protein ACIOMM_31910 [Streptomyces sp. NPDC087908]|uniref:hypothetical protein n=1 Tax=unclassified Streptomyces TaxID=2593676 RepID=UPI001C9C551D|nr:hypothetical protein [Streptomyces sp. adm13(2018)]
MADLSGGEGSPEHKHVPRVLIITGAVITILASVAGLLTTGVATFYSASIARAQLRQSQEAAEEKRREHAARVSYWVDVRADGTPRLHLTNRSPDPISNATMLFDTNHPGIVDEHRPATWQVIFIVKVPSVPPCSDLVFTSKEMRFGANESVTHPADGHPLPDPLGAQWRAYGAPPNITTRWVTYTDRDGTLWQRDGSGLLTQPTALDFTTEPGMPGAVQAVQPQSLKGCSGDGGLFP